MKSKLMEGSSDSRRPTSTSFHVEGTSPLGNLNFKNIKTRRKRKERDIKSLEAVSGKVPIRYTTAYPTFLKNSKHYPYRRLNDTHIEHTMQHAVKRIEDDIKDKHDERIKDASVFQSQLTDNKKFFEELEIEKKTKRLALKTALIDQMEKENYRRLKSRLRHKEPTATNYGPEETPADLQAMKDTKVQNAQMIREALESQMTTQYQKDEDNKVLERFEDFEAVIISHKHLKKETEEKLEKEKMAKSLYKEAWNEQVKMKKYIKIADE
eukprot:scpid95411/ scgid6312/ 